MAIAKTTSRTSSAGWTIVELLVVMSIIGILASLTMYIINSYQMNGRDAERESDTQAIARSFEISYLRDAGASGPTYPNTARATTTSGYAALFKGQDLAATKAPGTTAVTSIVAATSTTQPQAPAKDQYIYLPLTATNTLCNSTNICVRFLLYYRLESDNSVHAIGSIHQQ